MLEDCLHPDPIDSLRIARRLGGGTSPPAARGLAAGARLAGDGAWRLWAGRPLVASLRAGAGEAAALVTGLAPLALAAGARAAPSSPSELPAAARRLCARVSGLPDPLRRRLARPPSCFRSFDLDPADVARLMGRVAERWPERGRPIGVIGIRTSGSYLAPLAAACLESAGFQRVEWLTLRPPQRWLPGERRRLLRLARLGSLIVLVDDPPRSWGSVTGARRLLDSFRFPPGAVAAALPLLPGSGPPPAALRQHPMVLLRWGEWTIHQKLSPSSVRQQLAALWAGRSVVEHVQRRPLPAGGDHRGHASALYEVAVHGPDGRRSPRLVHVRGAGLGYFGSHSLAVATELAPFLPAVHGLRDGLLFGDWLPPADRLGNPLPARVDPEAVAEGIAGYVSERARRLPLAEDLALRLDRRSTAWGRAGHILSAGFGRAAPAVFPLTARGARRLLAAARPAVVDGNTALDNWFVEPDLPPRLRKIRFDESGFGNRDLCCCDPVFDLAGAAAAAPAELAGWLRDAYARRTGEAVPPERWLLYQLVHLAERHPAPAGRPPEVDRQLSSRVQAYFENLFFADLEVPSAGGLCALDLDGALESAPLGFSALDLDAAISLRALTCHGFRPVIASGRSLTEVGERCRRYRLAGGVAEYGAAVHLTAGQEVRELLPATDRAGLQAVRATLCETPGVALDTAHRRSVRAYRPGGRGARRGLPQEQVTRVLAGVSGSVVAIPGQAQTDFVGAGVTKAGGLCALATALGPAGEVRLALAVGDGPADLAMLRRARLGLAPANAQPELRAAGVEVLRQPFGAGVAHAVGRLLGHRPGACPRCRPPRLSSEARLLLELLGRERNGRLPVRLGGAAIRLARLALLLR